MGERGGEERWGGERERERGGEERLGRIDGGERWEGEVGRRDGGERWGGERGGERWGGERALIMEVLADSKIRERRVYIHAH